MKSPSLYIFLILILLKLDGSAQDPIRFQNEIDKLISQDHKLNSEKGLLLFVGSSSFRMWKDMPSYFESNEVINFGFGGSHMSDLLYFYNELIAPFYPKVIFIYEGDNDIAAGKEKKEIIKTTKALIKKIKKQDKEIFVVLVAAKPSPLRWEFEENYLELNNGFKKLAKRKNIYYADVWSPMMDKENMVRAELFIGDRLHMNEIGYIIWGKVLNDILISIDE